MKQYNNISMIPEHVVFKTCDLLFNHNTSLNDSGTYDIRGIPIIAIKHNNDYYQLDILFDKNDIVIFNGIHIYNRCDTIFVICKRIKHSEYKTLYVFDNLPEMLSKLLDLHLEYIINLIEKMKI